MGRNAKPMEDDNKTTYIYFPVRTFVIGDDDIMRCEKCDVKYPRDTAQRFKFCPWCGRFIEEFKED